MALLDTVLFVLNTAAARLNDAMKTPATAVAGQIGGEVVGPQQIFSQEICNAAWRRMQEFLASYKDETGRVVPYSPIVTTAIIAQAPAVTTLDPGINCYIGYDGYFDGTVLHGTPALPADLNSPLRLKERVYSATDPTQFTEMAYIMNGLSGLTKRDRNYNWGWDNHTIVLPGSESVMDFELRYIQALPDFLDNDPVLATPWYNQLVPIPRCFDALAWYICAEFANARGDKDGATLTANAEAAAKRLIDRDSASNSLRGEWVVPDIPAQTGSSHYDTVSVALNVTRVRLNAVNKAAADIINVQSPWTQQYTNQAFRKLQEYLANKGSVRVTEEVILEGLAANVNPDPAVQCYLDWNGYFDGTTLDPTIVLPENFIMPWKAWVRQNGTDALFVPMGQILNGLPNWQSPQPYNYLWEWRADRMYLLGATTPTDLRIRYLKYLDDFIEADVGSPPVLSPWYLQPVPIVRCTDALSLFICAEVAAARPDLGMSAATFTVAANDAADLIYNRDVRRTQQTTTTRRSLSGRLESGGGFADGWGGYGY